MQYATLMVQLVLGRSNAHLLKITGELATQLDASVIGIAASQPVQIFYGDGYVDGSFIEQERLAINEQLQRAQAEFRAALAARVARLEWRSSSSVALLSDHIARQARSCDLVIASAASGDMFDASRAVDPGDLVMLTGRPVLVVPAGVDTLPLARMVLAWKDSREARRAAYDALPLFRLASHVAVVELAPEDDLEAARLRVADVAAWLGRHGVAAEALASASIKTSDVGDSQGLLAVARAQGAKLVVAGAYGHSRLREWVLGGVTRGLLQQADLCTLLSH